VLSYPTLNFYRAHGTNEEAARRLVTESELYSLKISRMITPQGGHRFEPFSDLGTRAQDRSPVRSEGGQALGILGTAGFFGALYGAFGGRRRNRSDVPDTRPAWHRDTLLEQSTSTTILALLFGSVGGLAVIMALVGFAQIRVWNRIFLFVAFFAMVMVARWAEQLVTWIRGRSARPRPILGALAIGVLVFGIWDGIPPQRISYAEIEARHANDRDLVGRIEAQMPDGTAVFQLPVIPFPEEPPPGKMLDYDHLRAFLADDGSSLSWSYGSIRGRPDSRWQMYLRDQVGPVGALPALLGMGFTGIWLDTFGYTDGGAEARQIQDAVGVEPLVSSDGRFLFFDLRPYRASLDQTDEELRQAARDLLKVEPPAAPS
jgi:phosphoglycerol transferase